MYLYHASKLPSKIYHTSNMSRISVEGLNHYTVVYGLNCRRLKDSIAVHQTAQWETMEDCFSDICNIGVGYKRAKGYCRAYSNTPEASMITEVKTKKEPDLCYRCGRPHFQNNCKNHKSNTNNQFQNTSSRHQNYK